jgi:hypothetical protein
MATTTMNAPRIEERCARGQSASGGRRRLAAAGLAITAIALGILGTLGTLGGARAEPPPAAAGASGNAGNAANAAHAADSARAVVVELFTTQGCSTCPPADRLLSQLGKSGEAGGEAGQVIALAFHVDYWNRLGWTDPFSSPEWSARQAKYGRALHVDNVYTPEMVVNGRSECVGSKRDEVMRRIIAAQAAEPAGKVSIASAAVAGRKVVVKVEARVERPAHGLELWVALTQSGLTTAVGAGENKAATLHDDFVVRRLEKAFSLPGKPGAERSGEVKLAFDSGWDPSQLAVVAFLQDPSTLGIEGAAYQTLAAGR